MGKRYVVPEGMLNAVILAVGGSSDSWSRRCCTTAAEAAMGWLAKNPIVPTPEELDGILDPSLSWVDRDSARWGAREWQKHMFLAEPEVPEAVKDLLWSEVPEPGNDPVGVHNTFILAAFLRGKEGK